MPPWKDKRVVSPYGNDAEIFWVPRTALKPHPGFQGPALHGLMKPPQRDTYPALLVVQIGTRYQIEDGHHRFGRLGNYSGLVPVVLFRCAEAVSPPSSIAISAARRDRRRGRHR